MIRCPAPGERYSAKSFDGAALRHQGAENSALKNKAPLRLTSLKTSESTSIFIAYLNTAFVPRIPDDRSNIRGPVCRTLNRITSSTDPKQVPIRVQKEIGSMNAIAKEAQTTTEF